MKLGLAEHGEGTDGFGLDPTLATGPRDGTLQSVRSGGTGILPAATWREVLEVVTKADRFGLLATSLGGRALWAAVHKAVPATGERRRAIGVRLVVGRLAGQVAKGRAGPGCGRAW